MDLDEVVDELREIYESIEASPEFPDGQTESRMKDLEDQLLQSHDHAPESLLARFKGVLLMLEFDFDDEGRLRSILGEIYEDLRKVLTP